MWRKLCAGLGVAAVVLATAAHAAVVTIGTDADTFVDSKMVTSNFGASTTAEVGRAIGGGGVIVDRALLHFDLTSLPPDAVVTNATLRLFIDSTTAVPLNLGITVWLSGSFNESTVTWLTQPSVLPSPTDSATMSTTPGNWFTMDLTAIVTAVRAGTTPGDVWLRIAPTDESTDEFRNFDFRTKENGSGDDRAQLVLDFSRAASVPALTAGMTSILLLALGLVGALTVRVRGRA